MSETFYISLTWGIVILIIVSLVSVLIYSYCVKDNVRDYGEMYVKQFPKEAIEILKRNNYLKNDKSNKD